MAAVAPVCSFDRTLYDDGIAAGGVCGLIYQSGGWLTGPSQAVHPFGKTDHWVLVWCGLATIKYQNSDEAVLDRHCRSNLWLRWSASVDDNSTSLPESD
jgi:hypothetical protein